MTVDKKWAKDLSDLLTVKQPPESWVGTHDIVELTGMSKTSAQNRLTAAIKAGVPGGKYNLQSGGRGALFVEPEAFIKFLKDEQ